MSNVVFPRVIRQNRNDALVQHKIKPCFLIPKEKEYHPHPPCTTCFPSASNPDTCAYEELGVRNLLAAVQPTRKCLVSLHHILLQNFKSLQVHWGQLERLDQMRVPKLYIGICHGKWDAQVLGYTLAVGLHEPIKFLEQNTPSNGIAEIAVSHQEPIGAACKVLFINSEHSDIHLEAIKNSISSNQQLDMLLVPVSICYELPLDCISSRGLDDHIAYSGWKPSIRISFSLPHSFKDYICKNQSQSSMIPHLKQHLQHEIWKNTPIMSVHVLAMILQYRIQARNLELHICIRLMNEFQKKYHQHRDLAFVGKLDNITQYSIKVLSLGGVSPFTSVAVDVMKLESLMMKSLFSVMHLMEVDLHSDTCRVSQTALLENYRKMVGILRYEIDFITPPCVPASVVEKQVLDYLIDNQVLSQQSDEPNSSEQQMAKRIAYYLDVDSDEDEHWADRPVIEKFLYVNIDNALSHKWIATIATKLLDIYYVGAKQLLELRKMDVMEEKMFIKRVLEAQEGDSMGDAEAAVRNALKVFENEGIIECYSHSNIKILYLKDPVNDDHLWRFIHSIAEHC
ncbi:uncharacterized protein LOC130703565 [Daphnia carinata]|uniref:uncharacterized protein LOC130703565 n=1 Tax=Daphnia carinata TaxID=120202 RepID=UPI00257DE957|nr:uncharacterized protein LOC130703565 [Daphnia carinata]XP_057380981.1 uncharacterized protein LOC130703565 [Daphnia carinata]